MEVEHIIKSKKYFELTAEELAEVSNYASNEVEYDDMKSFLISTHKTVEYQKIKKTEELDKKVLNYLNHSYLQATPWYNSVLLFLFPRDKQFFKYPAFQIAIASLFVIGVFNVINFSSFDKNEMAFEDVQKYKSKEEIQPEVIEGSDSNRLEFKTNTAEVVELELEEGKELIKSELSIERNTVSNDFGLVEGFTSFDEVADEDFEDVVEESQIVELTDAVPAASIEKLFSKDIAIEEDVEAESVAIVEGVFTDQNVNKEVESRSYDELSVKKTKTLVKLESRSVNGSNSSIDKQVSIESTPELFQFFFEVK